MARLRLRESSIRTGRHRFHPISAMHPVQPFPVRAVVACVARSGAGAVADIGLVSSWPLLPFLVFGKRNAASGAGR